jgi:hypothetical protein
MARLGINRTLIFGGATLPAPSIATNGQRPMHTLLAVAPLIVVVGLVGMKILASCFDERPPEKHRAER